MESKCFLLRFCETRDVCVQNISFCRVTFVNSEVEQDVFHKKTNNEQQKRNEGKPGMLEVIYSYTAEEIQMYNLN